jgi:hypothetical protein
MQPAATLVAVLLALALTATQRHGDHRVRSTTSLWGIHMTELSYQAPDSPGSQSRALRLTFSYRGESVELADAQRVEMVVPPGDPPAAEPQGGFWIELRDASGTVLYRRVMHNPIASDYEVFPRDPGGAIVRQPVPLRQGAFNVVVPELREADTLSLMTNAPPGQPAARTASEIARFSMSTVMARADRRGGQ